MNPLHALPPPAGVARVLSQRPLAWVSGPSDGDLADRPPHPRAASGVVWLHDRLAVIQDDTSFLALVDAVTGLAESVALPPGADGRRRFEPALGNKHLKLDLESAVAWPGVGNVNWLAFGSGSTAMREHVVHAIARNASAASFATRVLDAPELYAALRAERAFAGDELNIEGAALVAGRVRLFQRGNGAAGPGRVIRDASVDLDQAAVVRWLAGAGPAPRPIGGSARGYDLGTIDGVRLTFTDATAGRRDGGHDGEVVFLASAEASPNSYDDGDVVGGVIGRIAADGAVARTLSLPVRLKVEGIVLDRDDPSRAWLVTDMDDPTRAAELLLVDLGGLW